MSDQADSRNVAPRADSVTDEAKAFRRIRSPHKGRIFHSRLGHLWRASGASVTRQVEAIGIETTSREVVHPGQAADRYIKCGAAVCGAMLQDDDAVRCECGHIGGPLVPHINFTPFWMREPQVFADQVLVQRFSHASYLPPKAV